MKKFLREWWSSVVVVAVVGASAAFAIHATPRTESVCELAQRTLDDPTLTPANGGMDRYYAAKVRAECITAAR